MGNRREVGAKGEDQAISFLEKAKYKIINRNVHIGRLGEIDIIAEDENCLVFIEVKYVRTASFMDPLYKITESKQKRILQIAEIYMLENSTKKDIRFDVITIIQNKSEYKINHICDAFRG